MNIIHFEINEEDKNLLTNLAAGVANIEQAAYLENKLEASNANLALEAEAITIFLGSTITKEVLDMLPKLKLLVTRSTGFDHIDVQYANSKGITVCNIPAYGSRTVAEYAFALMLGLSRKTFQANFQIKTGHPFSYEGFEGFNLQGKTLGVIGTGKIGIEVIKIAKGFDMHIIAFDLYPNQQKATELDFTYTELAKVLEASDIITLHIPYTKETHHLINSDTIKQIKKGALLINTSRGEIIETEAILLGVREKILSGVGLDVLEGEHELKDEMQILSNTAHQDKIKTLLEDHMLMNLPEVIVTPHMAFFTREAKQEIIKITLENITAFAQGKSQNVVTT